MFHPRSGATEGPPLPAYLQNEQNEATAARIERGRDATLAVTPPRSPHALFTNEPIFPAPQRATINQGAPPRTTKARNNQNEPTLRHLVAPKFGEMSRLPFKATKPLFFQVQASSNEPTATARYAFWCTIVHPPSRPFPAPCHLVSLSPCLPLTPPTPLARPTCLSTRARPGGSATSPARSPFGHGFARSAARTPGHQLDRGADAPS
jgi:hypothetical protein